MAEGEDLGLDLFDEAVAVFNKHQVEYLIVGGFAVVYHGYVRATQDLDLFIRRSEDNALKTVTALKELSGGELDLSPEAFTKGKGVILGEPPLRIDVIAQIDGVAFEDAWEWRQADRFGPATVHFISREHLIANKRAAGRPRDLDDVRELDRG